MPLLLGFLTNILLYCLVPVLLYIYALGMWGSEQTGKILAVVWLLGLGMYDLFYTP